MNSIENKKIEKFSFDFISRKLKDCEKDSSSWIYKSQNADWLKVVSQRFFILHLQRLYRINLLVFVSSQYFVMPFSTVIVRIPWDVAVIYPWLQSISLIGKLTWICCPKYHWFDSFCIGWAFPFVSFPMKVFTLFFWRSFQ